MKTYISLIVFAILFIDCVPLYAQENPIMNKELQEFATMLIGEFNSKDQANQDSTYFNIHLSMSRIWDADTKAIWLYVEQAMDDKREKPYRQRVYKLGQLERDVFTSDIYTIMNQERFIGLQNNKEKKELLTPDMIELKQGCTVILKKTDGIYIGGTDADKCPSDLRGASYATTKIIMSGNMLESWDQGFDKLGKQVWGATKGGYRFIKYSP
jgi:CpeT protein